MRRALRRAEASAEQVVSIIESITDGFIAIDGHWRCTYMNRGAEDVQRRWRPADAGSMSSDLFPLALPGARDRLRAAAAQAITVEFESFCEPWQRLVRSEGLAGRRRRFGDSFSRRHRPQKGRGGRGASCPRPAACCLPWSISKARCKRSRGWPCRSSPIGVSSTSPARTARSSASPSLIATLPRSRRSKSSSTARLRLERLGPHGARAQYRQARVRQRRADRIQPRGGRRCRAAPAAR